MAVLATAVITSLILGAAAYGIALIAIAAPSDSTTTVVVVFKRGVPYPVTYKPMPKGAYAWGKWGSHIDVSEHGGDRTDGRVLCIEATRQRCQVLRVPFKQKYVEKIMKRVGEADRDYKPRVEDVVLDSALSAIRRSDTARNGSRRTK